MRGVDLLCVKYFLKIFYFGLGLLFLETNLEQL